MLRIKLSTWLSGMTLLVSFIPSGHCSAQQYTLQDLGALPGDSVSKALSLNNHGQAAGDSSTPTAAVATLFTGGKTENISPAGSSVSLATGINDNGEVTGWSFSPNSATFDPQPFVFSNGAFTSIPTGSLFPSGAEPAAINNSGEVVGTGYITDANFHVFLYSGGKTTDLGPAGAFQAGAVAINNSGQIIGGYSLNSGAGGEFLISNGKMTTLPIPAGDSDVNALAINDNGEIAGSIYSTTSGERAATFSNGAWTDLGAFPGALGTSATAINISGQVVGTAIFPSTGHYPHLIPGKHVPFLVTGSALTDLNTLIASGTGFTLTDAVAINTSGQILCDAKNAAGSEHAVLLSGK